MHLGGGRLRKAEGKAAVFHLFSDSLFLLFTYFKLKAGAN